MKKAAYILCGILWCLVQFCSVADLGITQTGNPVEVSVVYKADTSQTVLRSPVHKVDNGYVNTVTVTSTRMVIAEVRLKSDSEEDSLSFESTIPYILDLSLSGQEKLMDSTFVKPGASYKTILFEIDKLEDKYGQIYYDNPDLQDRSIRIAGFIDNDSAAVFVFTTELDEELFREFEPPLMITENNDVEIYFLLRPVMWFVDELGMVLDPRLEENRSKIEENIKKSIDIFEKDFKPNCRTTVLQ